jgi:hypothetical protein
MSLYGRRVRPFARRAARRRRELAPGVPGEHTDRRRGGMAGQAAAGGEPGARSPAGSRPAQHAVARDRDRSAGPRRGQRPGMGLEQRADHRLSGGGTGTRRRGRLALHLAPLTDHRPVPAQDPDVQRRQHDDGHRSGRLLRLHPGERLVSYRPVAVFRPPGRSRAHHRPGRRGRGRRADQSAGAADRPSPRPRGGGPAVGLGGDVVRRASRSSTPTSPAPPADCPAPRSGSCSPAAARERSRTSACSKS